MSIMSMETLCFQSQPSQPSCLLILCTRLLTNLFFASSVCSTHILLYVISNCYQDKSPWCAVTKLLDQLQFESLLHRWWKQSLVVCYKIQHQLIAIDPSKYYTSGDSGTIGSHKIRQTRVQKDIVYHSFFPRTTREWNRLPESVLESGSLAGNFRNRVNTIPWTHLY